MTAPNSTGRIKDTAVHLSEPVSFFIVRSVVMHGEWKSIKIRTQTAVVIFQPFAVKSSRRAGAESSACGVPSEE